ncbi:ATPase AAA-type core domain-containing protein [Cupriavidus sp. H19C3]
MQPISRPSMPPDVLRSEEAHRSRKMMRNYWAHQPERRAQTSVPSVGISSSNDRLLQAVVQFSGHRCAFCEGKDDLFVHRFRPAANALPLPHVSEAHLYYVWLADAWQNLLPICGGCKPHEAQFPVDGTRAALPTLAQVEAYVSEGNGIWPNYPPKERPLLLDPCEERYFERHFSPRVDGELLGTSRKGQTTVMVFNLNRASLRHRRYQAYQSRLDALTELFEVRSRDSASWEALFDFTSLEFGGTWYLLLRRIARWINQAEGHNRQVSREQIRAFFMRLMEKDDAGNMLAWALGAASSYDNEPPVQRWSTAANGFRTAQASVAGVKLTNFKSIERLELKLPEPASSANDNPPPVPSLVILGENATGKSSILEAIALTLAPIAARHALRLSWPSMVLDPLQLGSDNPSRDQRECTVELTLTDGSSVRLAIERGVATVDSALVDQRLPVFSYGAFRRFAKGVHRAGPHVHVRNLFDGSTLSNPEPWLRSLRQEHFDMVIRTLRDLLSIDGEFDVIQRDSGDGSLRMITSVVEPDGQTRYSRTPLDAVSSGYRSMLAMLCDILKGLLDPRVYADFEGFHLARGVILVDEIEAHLHPRWKLQVMSSLRAALPRMTFIVTTHDPLCLRGMGDGEVVVLQRLSAMESVRRSELPILVERLDGLPHVQDLRIEQLLTSDFFQLRSTDDAVTDRHLARIADLIAAKARGEMISAEEAAVLEAFEADIVSALPVGSTEVHRIVQEAVAKFLQSRRDVSRRTLERLRDEAKAEILAALESL